MSSWTVKSDVSNDFRFDPNATAPTYIGIHEKLNAKTSDHGWKIFKFTYSGSDITRIQRSFGSWDNRTTLLP